jgi:phage/plasmid-associated DNA primase
MTEVNELCEKVIDAIQDEKKMLWNEKCINFINKRSTKVEIKKDIIDDITMDNFINNLDSNLNLICFQNKVFDLNLVKDNIYFRRGLPNDFLYTYSSLKIYELAEITDNIKDNCDKFINQIFPNEKIRNYFMLWCASIFIPGQQDKRFHFWFGKGNNGKTAMNKLLKIIFGNVFKKEEDELQGYYGTMPASTFTKRRGDADRATPHIDFVKKSLVIVTQEPENGIFNTAELKTFTGGDSMYKRGLYKNARMSEIRGKIVMQTNIGLMLDNTGKATEDRIVVIPFNSRFEDQERISDFIEKNPSYKEGYNIFPINKNLDILLEKIAPYFVYKILDKIPEYQKNGLQKIPELQDAYYEWVNEMDPFQTFITYSLAKIGDQDDNNFKKDHKNGVSLMYISNLYNNKYKYTYFSKHSPVNIKKVKDTLSQKYGEKYIKDDDGTEYLEGFGIPIAFFNTLTKDFKSAKDSKYEESDILDLEILK